MKDYPNTILVGFGHRARNGKDSAARMIKEKFNSVDIIHWADGVYEECINKDSRYPLIEQVVGTPYKSWYKLLNNKKAGTYKLLSSKEVPYLDKIFKDRNITKYAGMKEKDPEILQFWGTDFRRTFCDSNYWVNLTMKKVYDLATSKDYPHFILIPDTRFINEVEAIKNNSGYYVKVVRINDDNSQYLADDRDPNHPSEAELEGHPADSTFVATNLADLEKEVDKFINRKGL